MDSCMISLDVLKPISAQHETLDNYPIIKNTKYKTDKRKKTINARSTKRSK